MMIKVCPNCQATWIDGQLYWKTGKVACPHDLAGLLCNENGDEKCINPCKGSTSGTTWEMRREYIDSKLNEYDG